MTISDIHIIIYPTCSYCKCELYYGYRK